MDDSEYLRDNYSLFNEYCGALDEVRNRRLKAKKISLTAHVIMERATRADVRFADLLQTDALLFLRSCMPNGRGHWFPRCIVYARGTFELFARAASDVGREQLMILLGIQDWSDFRTAFESRTFKETLNSRTFFHAHIHTSTLFNLRELAPGPQPEF